MNRIVLMAVAALVTPFVTPFTASGQGSSINTFSPYTFYGLGDIHTQGAAWSRAMGGVGVGYRYNPLRNGARLNYQNPASLSSMPRKSFLFDVGLEGSNHYLSTNDHKTSYNTFNIRDVAIQMPLAQGLAVGLSVTPYSSVGYRLDVEETDPDILAGLLEGGGVGAFYRYDGSGDVTQGKISIGWEPLRNFSIGVDMVYLFGKIERSFITYIYGNGSTNYINTSVGQTDKMSRILWNFGAQYSVLLNNNKSLLTLGATYQPSATLNPEIAVGSSNVSTTAAELPNGLLESFKMPQTIAAGFFYNTHRFGLGFDWSYQKWASGNSGTEVTGSTEFTDLVTMKYRDTHTFKLGADFTPNRNDIRSWFKRLTYRAGLHYSDYYMQFNGQDIQDKAITLGVGVPLSFSGGSYADLGIELGQRGTKKHNLIKENYFKISVGVRMFGDDGWFRKRQYD